MVKFGKLKKKIKNFLRDILIDVANVLLKYKYNQVEDFDINDTYCPKFQEILVDSPHGYSPITALHLKKPARMLEFELENNKTISVADKHVFFDEKGSPVHADILTPDNKLITKYGITDIRKIVGKHKKEFNFDISVANETNSYFTDDVLSHNSITSAIFIVWYVLFNKDRIVVCLSQNQDKVKDLMEKIKTIIRHLPFWLKPGIIKDDVMQLWLDNGCKIQAQTTTPNSAAGITGHLIYMDEFALINASFLNDFYRTAYPTIAASKVSKIIITSTPRGKNKFFEIYDGAIKGKNYYNPIRVDWWEVPGRDEEWKKQEIMNMGSEEDFNQEYGNQFLAGSSMLLKSNELKKLARIQTKFVHRDIEALDDRDLEYEGLLTWHPKFDIDQIGMENTRFLFTIDLADGGGGDYSVINIWQILPMTQKEIDKLLIYTDEKDFFKLVQVGMFRSNQMEVPKVAQFFYHLMTDLFEQDRSKVILEMNYDGERFIENACALYGEENQLDDDYLFVKFKHTINAVQMKTGLKLTTPIKDSLCKTTRDKVKYNQLVPTEKTTIDEAGNFSQNKSGSYEAQSGHDDSMMTVVGASGFLNTLDYIEMIEDLMDEMPDGFVKLVNAKLNKPTTTQERDDDFYADLF